MVPHPARHLVPLTLSIALGACDVSATRNVSGMVADGSALTQVRAQVDGTRECAQLLRGAWPIEASAESLATPSVDALIAAGLLRRAPLPNETGERPRVRIVATPLGQAWLRLDGRGEVKQPYLCVGEKRVTSVAAVPDAGRVDYRYRVVDSPAWTRHPAIRAAFPFVARMTGTELAAGTAAVIQDGGLRVAPPVDAPPVGYEQKGFLICGRGPSEPASGCD